MNVDHILVDSDGMTITGVYPLELSNLQAWYGQHFLFIISGNPISFNSCPIYDNIVYATDNNDSINDFKRS